MRVCFIVAFIILVMCASAHARCVCHCQALKELTVVASGSSCGTRYIARHNKVYRCVCAEVAKKAKV